MAPRREPFCHRDPDWTRVLKKGLFLLIVLQAEVRDLLFAHHPAQGVLELRLLDEEVVLRVHRGSVLGTLEVEGQPFLDALHAGSLGEVKKKSEVKNKGRGKNRIAAEEVDLYLHWVAEPAKDVDVIPSLFVVAAGWVVVDPHLVIGVSIEFGIELGLENVLKDAELRLLLGLEALRVVEHLAVAVAEDVRRVPAAEAEHACLQHRREHRLDQGLAGLEVLAADRNVLVDRELNQRRDVSSQVGRTVGEGDPFHQGGIGIEHRWGDRFVIGVERRLEAFEGEVAWPLLHIDLGRGAPNHDQAVAMVCRLEVANVCANLLGHLHLRAVLDVGPVEALDVVLVEGSRHWVDGLKEVGDRLDVFMAVEDAALHRCFVGVVGEGVPGTEDDVVEVCERDELADEGRAVFRSLAKADGAHLGERAYGLAATATGVLDAADERRCDGTKADEKDAEAALCRLDRVGFEFDEVFCFQDYTSLAAE